MNISATNASEAGKMRDPHALETYMSDMVSNSDRKAGLITSHFPETEDGDIVIDLGSCTGELIHIMKINFPNLKFIGIDLSEQMLSAARKKEQESSFVLANVLEPPIKREVAKVIVMSSIFHELYSYGGGGFSLDSAKYGLILAFSLLKRGGRLIIKDPAKPEEPDEMLVFRLRKDDGDNPNPTELYTVHPDKLSTYSKYLRFQHDFSQTKRAEVEYLDDKDQFFSTSMVSI